MIKKYELTNETKVFGDRVLHRIRALVDIPRHGVKAGDLDEFMESDYNRFEIIGTPVAEGSTEWALYQMMQGKKVCSKNDVYIRYLDQNKRVCLVSKNGDVYQGDYSPEDWLYYVESTNCWEIYEEPKPAPFVEVIARIAFYALDTLTSNLVESLLKAQKNKENA